MIRSKVKNQNAASLAAVSPEKKIRPAIVLSTHIMGLGVIRALGIMGVPIMAVYYNKGDMGYFSKYVKEKIYAPHPEKDEDRFIDLLTSYAQPL